MEEEFIEDGITTFKVDGIIGRLDPKNPAVIYDNGIVEFWKDGIYIKSTFVSEN